MKKCPSTTWFALALAQVSSLFSYMTSCKYRYHLKITNVKHITFLLNYLVLEYIPMHLMYINLITYVFLIILKAIQNVKFRSVKRMFKFVGVWYFKDTFFAIILTYMHSVWNDRMYSLLFHLFNKANYLFAKFYSYTKSWPLLLCYYFNQIHYWSMASWFLHH